MHLHPSFAIRTGQPSNANETTIITRLQNDLALLELKEPLVFGDTVQPICLPYEFHEREYDSAIVAGWGMHAVEGGCA